MRNEPFSHRAWQSPGEQRVQIEQCLNLQRLVVFGCPEQPGLFIPEVLDHLLRERAGLYAPGWRIFWHADQFGDSRQRIQLHNEIRIDVRRLDGHSRVPQRAVVQPRRKRVVVLYYTVAVAIVFLEPPGIPAFERLIHLMQEVEATACLIEFQRSPRE